MASSRDAGGVVVGFSVDDALADGLVLVDVEVPGVFGWLDGGAMDGKGE
jgi:hypothetical protein